MAYMVMALRSIHGINGYGASAYSCHIWLWCLGSSMAYIVMVLGLIHGAKGYDAWALCMAYMIMALGRILACGHASVRA